MQIEFIDRPGGICTLKLVGRFRTGSDQAFQEARQRLKANSCSNLVVNCDGLAYIDSTGIGFLVGLFTTLRMAGGSLVLAGVGPRIKEVLRITALDTVLPIYETEAEALQALAQIP